MPRGTVDIEKQKHSKEVKLNLPEIDNTIQGCVYKLYCGKKFLIIKGKTLAGSLMMFEKGYSYFVGYEHNITDKNRYYYKMYYYIFRHPDFSINIQVLFTSENAYDLLVFEQEQLSKYFSDKKCFNNNLTSYINVFNEKTDSYGWMSKQDVERFNLYLSEMCQ